MQLLCNACTANGPDTKQLDFVAITRTSGMPANSPGRRDHAVDAACSRRYKRGKRSKHWSSTKYQFIQLAIVRIAIEQRKIRHPAMTSSFHLSSALLVTLACVTITACSVQQQENSTRSEVIYDGSFMLVDLTTNIYAVSAFCMASCSSNINFTFYSLQNLSPCRTTGFGFFQTLKWPKQKKFWKH